MLDVDMPNGVMLAEEIRREITQGLDRTKEITDDEVMEVVTEAVFSRSAKKYLSISFSLDNTV